MSTATATSMSWASDADRWNPAQCVPMTHFAGLNLTATPLRDKTSSDANVAARGDSKNEGLATPHRLSMGESQGRSSGEISVGKMPGLLGASLWEEMEKQEKRDASPVRWNAPQFPAMPPPVFSQQPVRHMPPQNHPQPQRGQAQAQGSALTSIELDSNSSQNPIIPSIVVLEFKLERRAKFHCKIPVMDGQNLLVSTPEGQDVGLCVGVYRYSQREGIPCGGKEQGDVVRVATDEDVHFITESLPNIEAFALSQCHQLIHFLHLPIIVVDAECQFDRTKVTIFYKLSPQSFTSASRDWSRLVRELGFAIKTRVVLHELPY